MFKKEKFNNLNTNYKNHAYKGLMGFFMNYCHKQLEKIDLPEKMPIVLEIGAGDSPHIKYLKHDYDEYHIIETSDYALENYNENLKIIKKKYDGKIIPYPDEKFDRIIISHCLEHIPSPENFLIQMRTKIVSKLRKIRWIGFNETFPLKSLNECERMLRPPPIY